MEIMRANLKKKSQIIFVDWIYKKHFLESSGTSRLSYV